MAINQRRQTLKSLLAFATAGGALAYTKGSTANEPSSWQHIVTDTSIADHSDPGIPGSIAWALSQATARGGGTVVLGTGRFRLYSQALVISGSIRLIGASKAATTIVQTHPSAAAIIVASGTPHVHTGANLEHFGIEMPTQGYPGDAIMLVTAQSGRSNIVSINISGGTENSWGISNYGNNMVNYLDIHISGGMNGLRWITDYVTANINYGDCYVQGVDIFLSRLNNIGIYLSGKNGAVVNNIHFSRIEIAHTEKTPYWTFNNAIGIYLSGHTSRNSFAHVDLENLRESLKIDSPNCFSNTFFHMLHIGAGGSSPTLDSSYFENQTFMGGNKPFLRYTKLSLSREIIRLTSDTELSYAEHAHTMINNTGASKPIALTLPSAHNDTSYEFIFFVVTPQPITLIPERSDNIIQTDGAIKHRISSDAVAGRSISVRNVNYKFWMIQSKTGNWT